MLQGRLAILLFDDEGVIQERRELAASGPECGAEVEAGCWHALVALQSSIVFELKQGPYSSLTDKDFAAWAPDEGQPGCARAVRWYEQARVGERFPNL